MMNSTKTSQLKMPITNITQAGHPQLMMPQNQQRLAKSRESTASDGPEIVQNQREQYNFKQM